MREENARNNRNLPKFITQLVSLDDTRCVWQMERVSFADDSTVVVRIVRDWYLQSSANNNDNNQTSKRLK